LNILFLNPPFLGKFSREQRSPAITKSGTIYFPMWLSYCAGYLEEQGFTIDLIDAPADNLSLEDVLKRFHEFNPDVAVVATSTPSIYQDVETTATLVREKPTLKTVLVGPHVSVLDIQTLDLNPALQFVARREYEVTVLELCQALEKGEPVDSIAGITYRKADEILRNPDRELNNDLDILPFVSRTYKKFLRIENYFSSIALYPQVTIITGRGCLYGCKFCVYPQTQMGRKYRFRSVEKVLDEVEYILETFPQIKEIFFEDDTLTSDKERCRNFCNSVLERGVKFNWTANSRADVDFETLSIMKKAGCRLLCVGVESGNQEILDRIGKSLTLAQIESFFSASKKAGIIVHGCFMVGNPGETHETMAQTLKFAKKLKPDTAQFFPIMVYPGTKTYNWARENNYIETNDFSRWLTPEGLHNCVVSSEDLSSAELVNFCNGARRQFYLRLSYIFSKLKQVVKSPGERRRTWKSAMTFRRYILDK